MDTDTDTIVGSYLWNQSSRKMQSLVLAGRGSLGDRTRGALPGRFWQPLAHGLVQTTNSLHISNGAAPNNKLKMASNHITIVINVSAEAENTSYEGIHYEDIQYGQVPVADTRVLLLCDFRGPNG